MIKKHNHKIIYLITCKENTYICKVRTLNNDIHHEINIFNLFKTENSDYIANYIEYRKRDSYIYFIIEYINGVELFDYIKNVQHDNDLIELYKNIFECIKFIHDKNILHCDIKSNNIIIDTNNKPKLIDFDLARLTDDGSYLSDKIFGTISYLSPESYDLGIYTKYSDIWSVGIMIYINITKKYPFDTNISVINSYSNFYRRNVFKYPNFDLLKNINNIFHSLILQMLEFKDYNRCTIEEAIYMLNKIENI